MSNSLHDFRCDSWPSHFVITIWFIWFWRNERIFKGNNDGVDIKLSSLFSYWCHVHHAFTSISPGGPVLPPRRTHLIGWDPPMIGWVKVNIDRASKGNSSMVGSGGGVRNHLGSWVGGFVLNVDFGTSVLAEVWATFHGLSLAWKLGYPNVVLEVDSKLVVQMIQARQTSD